MNEWLLGGARVSNAVIQHGQFDFWLEIYVARAETSGRDGLGVEVAERLGHLATNADATAQRHLLRHQMKTFVQRTAFQFTTHTSNIPTVT